MFYGSADAGKERGERMDISDDPEAVASYAQRPRRQAPGFAGMQRMALVLLDEKAPPDARILVVGARKATRSGSFATPRSLRLRTQSARRRVRPAR